VNALANPEIGNFVSKYFVASFQRVGTFKINNGQKQGGNVATYFCAPDGRVLHAIAGPVKADAFLEEATWIVRTTKEAVAESKDATRFKHLLRKAHADRLEEKYGVRVTPVLRDEELQNLETASAYRDKDGRRLAPVLPLPPIEGRTGGRALDNAGRIHLLLAAHATMKIESLYGAVFQGILGEKVSTKPVQTATPFPGRRKATDELLEKTQEKR
jgi:hypothetical protein